MAHESLRRLRRSLCCPLAAGSPLVLVSLLTTPALGCAASAPPPVALVAPPHAPAVAFTDDPRPLSKYHSKRLSLYLPLPDGPRWRIDDHSRPELSATHAPTQSKVTVAFFRTDELVGRTQCEAQARARRIVPTGEMRTLESTLDITQENYDTRIWVAVEPGSGPASPVIGHVMAFGGFLRKCYVFDFSTRIDSIADEPVLSSRLAFARERILGGLKLEAMGVVPRETPSTPAATPP